MRCVPFYACCGAYFLCDIDEAGILDTNIDASKLPHKADPTGWEKRGYPDLNKAGAAFHINNHPAIAYMFAILKRDEKPLGKLLCKLHGFKLMSETKERLLYCREREGRK